MSVKHPVRCSYTYLGTKTDELTVPQKYRSQLDTGGCRSIICFLLVRIWKQPALQS